MTDPSPLLEVQPQVLQEYFDRDPLDLSDEAIDVIVTQLRQMRQRFLLAENAGKRPPRQKKAAPAPKAEVTIEDLEL